MNSHVIGITYSSLSGLREEEVCEDALGKGPDNEDDIGLPLDLLDGNRPSKLVEEAGSVDKG